MTRHVEARRSPKIAEYALVFADGFVMLAGYVTGRLSHGENRS